MDVWNLKALNGQIMKFIEISPISAITGFVEISVY